MRVAAEDVAQSDEKAAAVEAPGIILERAQIIFLKFRRTFGSNDGILEAGGAIFVAEEKAESVLGIIRAAAVTAANSDAGVDLETFGAIRVNQFNGARAFPGDGIAAGVRVNASGRIEHVLEIDHD